MKAALDVHYVDSFAVAACVVFQDWNDRAAFREHTTFLNDIEPYQPGMFFRRELPCLLAVLQMASDPLDVVIVDGYVWLGDGQPGLGAHLFSALDEQVPVIGVAKTRFASASSTLAITRGSSNTPLYVTAAGMPADSAAQLIQGMHGKFRIPTLLKRVDQLCRSSLPPSSEA